MYYSSSANCFIPDAWKTDGTYSSESWPADAVLLTGDEVVIYKGQPAPVGKLLGSHNGRPVWVDEPPAPPMTRDEIEASRLRAYAEPLTGSDRYFSEAQRMQAMGEVGWEAVRDAGIARFEEIQLLYPWP